MWLEDIYDYMKLIKTVKKLVEEAERNYISACESFMSLDEIEKLERNYKNSLRILEMIEKKSLEKKIKDTKKK